jgi:hypothetical protein
MTAVSKSRDTTALVATVAVAIVAGWSVLLVAITYGARLPSPIRVARTTHCAFSKPSNRQVVRGDVPGIPTDSFAALLGDHSAC